MRHIVLICGLFSASAASAADLSPQAYQPPIFTWSGIYVGVSGGAAFRGSSPGNQALLGILGASIVSSQRPVSFIGGGQIGANLQTGPIVFGVEGDAKYRADGGYGGYLGTARARLGLAFDRALLYSTGGFAYGNAFNVFTLGRFNASVRTGYTVGGGIEYALTDSISVRGEYAFVDLGGNSLSFAQLSAPRAQSHTLQLGLNYRFISGTAFFR